ncbi:MAG: hypothetical protein OQL19_10330 [Gammaproteobacteria bacterium]|nr:hypothetical protein [Gammaproteobacteria bacterium]
MNKGIKFKGVILSTLLLLLASLFFTVAQAETEDKHYISPRLQLGLHTRASMDSPIKVLVSSGMVVELISTEKEFSQIKTAEGDEGWVKSKFITTEEPAVQKIEKMKLALERAQQSLKDRLQAEESKDNEVASEDTTKKEKDMVSATLIANEERRMYESTIEGLKEELKAWEQLDRQDKQAQKEKSEKDNQILKEKLAMIASVAIGEDVDASQFDLSVRGELPDIESKTKQTLIKIIKKNYLLLLMVAGLSFLLGIFVMDLVNRKRHGGYRI